MKGDPIRFGFIQSEFFCFLLVFFQQLGFGSKRSVYGIEPEVEKEGAILFVLNKADRMVGQDIG